MRKLALSAVILLAFSAAAFGQCSFAVNPSGQAYADSLGYLDTGHDPLVIQVTASSKTCAWTADQSDGFASVSSGVSGTGNGSVTYSVAPNTTNIARTVVLNIAGNAITLTQRATASTFVDISLIDPFFDAINLMRSNSITSGCLASPLSYCENTNVTRDQMAVFVVRTILGGGPNVDNFQYSSTPYFTDVPANYQFFKWVQKLKEIGITSGTTATTYSPDAVVTRGQMAVFLIRAGFNTLLNPSLPLITSASPNHGAPGTTVNIAVTGLNTHFASDTTILADNGVTGNTPVVTDATHLTVTLNIPSGTPLGQISITAETLSASEEATLPNGFTVGTGDPVPTISNISPASGPIGTAVTITGTTLVSSFGTPVSVLVPLQGGGLTGAPVTSATATSLTYIVPSTAATGKIILSSASGNVTSATAFTVVPSSTYTISAGPSTGNVIAGQTSTYTVNASSSSGFSGLAQLSVSGLPSGVTGTFNPAQIAVGEQSTLTISAPANQQTNTATVAIGANAVVDGMAVPAATTVTLNVTPITTSFLGRTVVDDATNTSLVGVTVTMLGLDGSGHTTSCSGSTISDASGNFALTNLPNACLGPQLVRFNGDNVTSPAGKYAGLNLVFTLVANQVVVSPVLVHMPRMDNLETYYVKQNATADQGFSFKSIPGLSVTVYAGTVITAPDGTVPDPYPFSAIRIPIDRLPDALPPTSANVTNFLVSFPPDGTNTSQPVPVSFPNTLNTPPGTSVALMTLNPTLGRTAPYGTGTVSNDGTTIVPDIDPSTGTLYHRFGISHFDWQGPSPPAPPSIKGSPEGGSHCACSGDPVDLSSGAQVMSADDLSLEGGRGGVTITRSYASINSQVREFGVGSSFNYGYLLDSSQPQSAALVNLLLPNGVQIPFSRVADGTLVNQSVPSMAGAVMTPAADGSAVLRMKNGVFMSFQPVGQESVLTGMGDPDGNVTTIVHQDLGYVTEIDDPVGRRFIVTNSNGLITSITDPIGRKVSYAYDGNSCLISFTNPEGGITKYAYDSQNRLVSMTDPLGAVRIFDTYDANGRVIQQDIHGGSFKYAYTLLNPLVPTSPVLQAQETDPNGNVTAYRFSGEGFLISVTDALGQTRTLDRQNGTNLLLGLHGTGTCSVCGETAGGDVSYTYDASGNLLTHTDASGGTVTFTYDPVFSNVTTMTDPLGNISRFTYDSHGNVLTITDAANAVTTYSYNSFGQLTRVVAPNGAVSTRTYNAAGDLIKATDPTGNTIQFGFDGLSRPVQSLDSAGNTTSVVYDQMGRVISGTDELGAKSTLTWDIGGNLLAVTDASGNKTSVAYDAGHRPVTKTDPLGKTESYSYDASGNLTAFTDRRGLVSTFQYDALNRVTQDTYSDGQTVRRTFDAGGALVRVDDSGAGAFNYTYNAAGYLLKSVTPNGTMAYTRDLMERVLTERVNGEPAVSYTYDAVGNVGSIGSAAASQNSTFDVLGQPLTITRSNGVKTTATYDQTERLLSMSYSNNSSPLLSLAYSYDAFGHRSSVQTSAGQAPATQSATATSTADNRSATFGGHTYTHDANGNRLTDTGPAGTTSYTWDARNQLQTMTAPGGMAYAFAYDYAGNLISNRLTTASGDNVQKFLLDENLNVAATTGASGTTVAVNGPAINWNVASIDPKGNARFPVAGSLNSTAMVTDSTGASVGQTYYEPFGVSTQTGASYPFQFTGQYQIAPNLYYMRARFYDAASQRFISEDPLGFAGGDMNLYRYAGNDPTESSDPYGLVMSDEQLGYRIIRPGAKIDVRFPDSYTISAPNFDGPLKRLPESDTLLSMIAHGKNTPGFNPVSVTVDKTGKLYNQTGASAGPNSFSITANWIVAGSGHSAADIEGVATGPGATVIIPLTKFPISPIIACSYNPPDMSQPIGPGNRGVLVIGIGIGVGGGGVSAGYGYKLGQLRPGNPMANHFHRGAITEF